MKNRKFNKEERSFILYDWANSAYTMTITSTIFPLFFKSAMESTGVSQATSTAYWGYANSIGTLVISLLAPIIGTIADYKDFKKRFFTFFFLLGVAFTGLLGFIPMEQWKVLFVFYIINSIGYAGANIFYDAFIVDVTSEERMDKVSTYAYAYGYIGSTIPFILCMAIVILAQNNIIGISVTLASQISFIITALWWGLFTIPFFKNVRQKYYIEREDRIIGNSFKRLGKTLKNIRQNKGIFLFLLAYFFYIDGVDTIIKMATSYGADLGISDTNLLIILLVTQFVAFPFAILYGKLSEKIKNKRLISIAIIIYIGICIYAFFLKSTLDFLILAILVGATQGGIQSLSRSYFGKIIPKEKSNEFFGFYNIFGKFAAIMGPALVGIVSQITNKTNYGVVSLVLLFLIGGIILRFSPDE